jgi:hypothetical protein
LKNVEKVDLIVFRNDQGFTFLFLTNILEPLRSYQKKDISTLVEYLTKVHYDGGTDLENLVFPQEKYEKAFLFTDGFSTLSNDLPLHTPSYPVFPIINTPVNNLKYLQFFSTKTGGFCLNLLQLKDDEQVVKQVYNSDKYSFLKATFDEGKIAEVLPSNPVQGNNKSIMVFSFF